MNLEKLGDLLTALSPDIPVAYYQFEEPTLTPFITYLVQDGESINADNRPIHEILEVDIELYSTDKNLEAEKLIKDMLKENDLPWTYEEIHIKAQNTFQSTFSVQLIGG
jgi:hypothetical protein